MSDYKVLVVDDDRMILQGLEALFEDTFIMIYAASGAEAVAMVKDLPEIGVIVMDIKMPGMNGIEAARVIREIDPDISIIFHTGYPGLYDESEIDKSEKPFGYIQKGESAGRLERQIRNALETYRLKQDISQLTDVAERSFGIVGRSKAMQDIYHIIRKAAPTDSKIMIFGETGTGKGLVARAIHESSARVDKPFKKFNCNHTPSDLVESELFGHLKGSFSGASENRPGLFEYADGGTVFLDEIGDLSIASQGKILDIIETGEYEPLGWTGKCRKTDVRIICATHRNLEKMMEKGKFREDLYYRLKNAVITLPPLRERKEDIPLLVNRFLEQFSDLQQHPQVYIDPKAVNILVDYEWPGNVRQLQDTIRSLLVMTESQIIFDTDVLNILGLDDSSPAGVTNGTGLAAKTREFRRNCIIEALHRCEYNVNAAAKILEVDPSNLRKWIKAYDIPID